MNYLNAEYAKYDKEGAADKHDISYWTKWRQQSHYYQLEARSSINYSAKYITVLLYIKINNND